MQLNEAQTRAVLINQQLLAAGWKLSDRTQVGFEIPVEGYDPAPWQGFTDFCLFRPEQDVLTVVEAKRCSRNPREGGEQLRQYIERIAARQSFAPFGFMTNGLRCWFWEVGEAHPREVPTFFSPEDLKRLLFLRQNRRPLAETPISNSIVNRPYQHEAVRRVAEAFVAGKRRALLVMATGTGKTRTTMALADLFLRANQARHILFVADRDALVEQALADGFQAHLPHEPRVRIHSQHLATDKRLYVATLQTLSRCFERLSPGFFDLIVFDEAHRSIFNRFGEVIEWFDARMIGLTATPASFLDRDTFRTFQCRDQAPTFLYTFQEAVRERHLVDFTVHQAQTGFQRAGIKGADLGEEDRNALIEQGIDPDAVDYSGTDLEVFVSNRDTLRKQWEEIWEATVKDAGGQLPAKTIIFAMTKEHANRIREVFEEMYPQHVGLLQVIHHGMERVHDGPWGRGLIGQFKHSNLPRIAVSVDMLDTGVDVPEVVNLVFMKPVQSRIKLWQMVGRGTRNDETCRYRERLPADGKTGFLIIDFWQNDFGKQAETRTASELPVLVALFNTRLALAEATLATPTDFTHAQAIRDVRAMLARIPRDSYSVRKVWQEIDSAWGDEFWAFLNADKLDFLRLKVGPLLRFVAHVDVAAETFTHKVERLKLQTLQRKVSTELLQTIADDVSRLPGFVHEDPQKQASIRVVLSNALPNATPQQLTQVITDLADEMRNRRDRPSAFVTLDLPDFVAARGHILIGPTGVPIYVEEYRRSVEARIQGIAENHPALVALRQGQEPTDEQLVNLERTLHVELSGGDLQLSPDLIRKAYGLRVDKRSGFLAFLRHVLELDAIPDYAAVVERAFTGHITGHHYTGDQIRFLRAVQEVFLTKGRLEEADLYEAPLTQFGRNAADRYFTPAQLRELVAFTGTLAA